MPLCITRLGFRGRLLCVSGPAVCPTAACGLFPGPLFFRESERQSIPNSAGHAASNKCSSSMHVELRKDIVFTDSNELERLALLGVA